MPICPSAAGYLTMGCLARQSTVNDKRLSSLKVRITSVVSCEAIEIFENVVRPDVSMPWQKPEYNISI